MPETLTEETITITPDEGPAFEITVAQRDALNRKFLQSADGAANFGEFRARAGRCAG